MNILLVSNFSIFQHTEYPSTLNSNSSTADIVDDILQIHETLNAFWVIVSFILIFFMQAGFALFEVGSIRSSSIIHVLVKNLFDTCLSSLSFYLVGYAIAFGPGGLFVGASYFALYPLPQLSHFLFQSGFCSSCVTILSGSISERTYLRGYAIYSIVMSSIIYPVVVRWFWFPNGWLSPTKVNPLFGIGAIDFAGSGVIHVLGGVTSLVGNLFIGPRKGRFDPITHKVLELGTYPLAPVFTSLGFYLLWLGWFGFTCGSSLIIPGSFTVVSQVATNTLLMPSIAGFIGFLSPMILHQKKKTYDLKNLHGSLMMGLAAMTSGAATISIGYNLLLGCFVGLIFEPCVYYTLHTLKIDDPVNAFVIHGIGGAVGLIGTGLLSDPLLVEQAYHLSSGGLFFGYWELFASNLTGLVAVVVWSTLTSGILFYLISNSNNLVIPSQIQALVDQSVCSPQNYIATPFEKSIVETILLNKFSSAQMNEECGTNDSTQGIKSFVPNIQNTNHSLYNQSSNPHQSSPTFENYPTLKTIDSVGTMPLIAAQGPSISSNHVFKNSSPQPRRSVSHNEPFSMISYHSKGLIQQTVSHSSNGTHISVDASEFDDPSPLSTELNSQTSSSSYQLAQPSESIISPIPTSFDYNIEPSLSNFSDYSHSLRPTDEPENSIPIGVINPSNDGGDPVIEFKSHPNSSQSSP